MRCFPWSWRSYSRCLKYKNLEENKHSHHHPKKTKNKQNQNHHHQLPRNWNLIELGLSTRQHCQQWISKSLLHERKKSEVDCFFNFDSAFCTWKKPYLKAFKHTFCWDHYLHYKSSILLQDHRKTLHLLFTENQTVRSTFQSFLSIKHEQFEELERQVTTKTNYRTRLIISCHLNNYHIHTS